jgi:RNA polymerase sigma factor (sigma-70 family)
MTDNSDILKFQGLITKLARRFSKRSGIDFLELSQAGFLGALLGKETFDESLGNKLITHIYWHVIKAMQNCIAESHEIRQPQNITCQRAKFSKISHLASTLLGEDWEDVNHQTLCQIDKRALRSNPFENADLKDAINHLPDDCQNVIVRKMSGETCQEIAQELNMSASNVSTIERKAVEKLRKFMV